MTDNALTVTWDLNGPLFRGDPSKTMWENIEAHYAELARYGESEARRGFSQSAGGRQAISALGDRVADHVIGRVMARPSRGGRGWRAHGVVQVYNEGLDAAQSRSLMAAGSILEGRMGVIKRVTRDIAGKMRRFDLTKGLE
ncbi:MAG TPA: hypothetical protein VFI15_10565 [Candidatus Limnocylindrales bacterium]|nr:hypothetical protein [Candidatus Limnocylindrales bacterium]